MMMRFINFIKKLLIKKPDEKLEMLKKIHSSLESFYDIGVAKSLNLDERLSNVAEEINGLKEEISKFIELQSEMIKLQAKYFNLEVEFTKKELEKEEITPTKDDAVF